MTTTTTPAPVLAVYVGALWKINRGENGTGDGEPLRSHRIDAATRKFLARHGWIPPTSVPFNTTVTLTDAGRAVLERALTESPVLTAELATVLREVESAGSGGVCWYWPGRNETFAAAAAFGLVSGPAGAPPTWDTQKYMITDAGSAALKAWYAERIPPLPTAAQAAMLAELVGAGGHLLGFNEPPTRATIRACEQNSWIRYHPVGDGSSRQHCHITEDGRRALQRRLAEVSRTVIHDPAPKPRRVSAGKLIDVPAGQEVRLVNTRPYPAIGPQWRTLQEVTVLPRRGHMPGGVLVTVCGDKGPVLYPTDVPLYPGVLFEIRPQG